MNSNEMNNRAELRQQLRETSEAQISAGLSDHQRRVHRIKTGMKRRRSRSLAPKQQPLDFLAIGDSWFEYPLSDSGLPIPFWNAAIVGETQLQSMGNPPPLINSIALHGQAMTSIMGLQNQETMQTLLEDKDEWLNENSGLPDGILVSGGGDDIVGDQFIIYLDDGGSGLDLPKFQGVLESVEASYKDLFDFRNEFAPNVPIFGHCYDYALPNGRGAVGLGPWLRPSLDFAGYDYAQDFSIVADAIDRFHDLLYGLADVPTNLFTLVDTRGTLTRNTFQPLGWANEIHPYYAGFSALAGKFLSALKLQFSGRI
jgi:hypothetical protein